MMKKVIILLLCVCFFLSGCSTQKSDNPDFGGEISLFAYSPDTLNPLKTEYQTNASLLTSLIYETLITVNQDLSLSPCLAESWSFSQDMSVCTLKLKEDALFSDGTPVTAEHVKLSLQEAVANSGNLYNDVSQYVESCTANGNTLTLNLKKTGTGVLSCLDFPIIKSNDQLLGSGLYKISSNDKSSLILNAISNTRTNIEKITVRFYPKEEMKANSFISAETDVFNADMTTLSKLTSKTNVAATNFVTDTFLYLGFNNNSTILSDYKARYGIAHLIDKDKLLEEVFVNYCVKTNSPFKPSSIYSNLYDGDFNYDKELAKKYLDESETEDYTFNILVNSESDTKKKIAQHIAKALNENNMNVSVTELPFDDYIKAIEEENYTMYVGEINIPESQDLSFLLKSSYNNLIYSSSYMDSLLDGFSNTVDSKQKMVYAQEIQKLLLKDMPIISLCYKTNILMTSNKIHGEFSPKATNLYHGINSWIIK